MELTGEWEYKLRLIDQGKYSPSQFLTELKQMVAQLVRGDPYVGATGWLHTTAG